MKLAYLLILLLFSTYFVVGGIASIIINEKFEHAMSLPKDPTFDQQDGMFRNIEEQDASEEYDKVSSYYPIYTYFGSTIGYLITLISFGMMGAIIRVLLTDLSRDASIERSKAFSLPILGGLIGLLTIVVSELLPEFKFQSGNDKVYYSMALLGGIFTQELFQWAHKRIQQVLNTEKEDHKRLGHDTDI